MQIKINEQNLNLSDDYKDLVEEKVAKLQNFADRLSDESTEFRVDLRHQKTQKSEDTYICQLTIFAPRAVIRMETHADNLDSAIDNCMYKIKSPIERYKSKLHKMNKRSESLTTEELIEEDNDKKEEEFEIPKIFKRKRFSSSNPITEDEAIERLELVGHDFFLFNNETTGRFSVLYKRHDGYYGIVEPKMDND